MDYLFAPECFVTSDLMLRPFMPGDGQAVNEATVSSYEHLSTFLAWPRPDIPVEETEQFCRIMYGKYLKAEEFGIGIFTPDGSTLLGGTGFHPRDYKIKYGLAEIGMWIRASAAGKGIGTLALKAMVDWGFSAWPWKRILWRCDVRNIPSKRCAEKAGLRLEGTIRGDLVDRDKILRDAHHFGMLREEWELTHKADKDNMHGY